MCSTLDPSFAEQHLWDGQCGFGRDESWEFLPAPFPIPVQPSLPSCLQFLIPLSSREREKQRQETWAAARWLKMQHL